MSDPFKDTPLDGPLSSDDLVSATQALLVHMGDALMSLYNDAPKPEAGSRADAWALTLAKAVTAWNFYQAYLNSKAVGLWLAQNGGKS